MLLFIFFIVDEIVVILNIVRKMILYKEKIEINFCYMLKF